MGKTLNLLDHLLSDVRRLLAMEQTDQALKLLRRSARLAELPLSGAGQLHQLFGEVYLKRADFRRARRHLRVALKRDSSNAEIHYLLARAIECDPRVDAACAGRSYERALELAPRESRFLADAGAYFVQLGRTRRGLELLEAAVDAAPDDFDVLQTLVENLCEIERFDAACAVLWVARFRLRGDPLLATLRELVEFRRSRHAQRGVGGERRGELIVLPYLRVVRDEPRRANRRDAGAKARLPMPHFIHRLDAGRSG